MFARKTRKIVSKFGSIAALEEVFLGGTKQFVLMRGENIENPIMLFLHGGPGTAQIGFAPKFQRNLEKDFLVVNWDQKGAGISYSPTLKKEEMTIESMLHDAVQLIKYLLKRFNQSKLFLVGHSWGTVLGTLTAQRFPQYIHSYIGIGQVAHMEKGEKISYEYTLNKAKELKNEKAFKELTLLDYNPSDLNYLLVQRKWLSKFGGSAIGITDYQLIYSNMFSANEYTFKDWFTYMKASRFSLESMWSQVLTIDFLKDPLQIEVPVYIFAGKQDYQTPTQLANQYFDNLDCPHKGFILFEQSAHLPNFEEPQKFYEECVKIKEKHTPLLDERVPKHKELVNTK
ncbi:alpha/beta hydrolase [Neobacillus drentensis]|uniref:alpha/beta hydrolase n=1 Tax=Neobacillus drentensis TaxID=220684 RepID=UPI002FFF19EC